MCVAEPLLLPSPSPVFGYNNHIGIDRAHGHSHLGYQRSQYPRAEIRHGANLGRFLGKNGLEVRHQRHQKTREQEEDSAKRDAD
jgi:hypothetical protein